MSEENSTEEVVMEEGQGNDVTFVEYQSHKRFHATPMNRGKYNEYRGWKIPDNENPEDEGYLVVYGMGTKDHYESWSPKRQLEEGSTDVDLLVESEPGEKTLHNSTVSGAAVNVPDLKIAGNGDLFKLLSKASSASEGWMKSTKAMQLPNGVMIQVTTQQTKGEGAGVAEALAFAPGVKIKGDDRKGYRLV